MIQANSVPGSDAGGARLLTAKELAAVFVPPVTPQTVNNWRLEGMKPAGGNRDTGYLYNPDDCLAWQKKHRSTYWKGGRRPGAGRPKAWKPTIKPGEAGQDFSDSELAAAAKAPPQTLTPENAAKLKLAWEAWHLGEATGEQLRIVCGIDISRPVAAVEGKHLAEMATANEKNRKAALEAKKLLRAEDVEKAWTEFLQRFRVRLEGLTVKVSDRVMAEGGVGGDRYPRVRAGVNAEIESLIGEFFGAAVGVGVGVGVGAAAA